MTSTEILMSPLDTLPDSDSIRFRLDLSVRSLLKENTPKQIEPRHDKTNKMSVRQAKTQISLDIRPV